MEGLMCVFVNVCIAVLIVITERHTITSYRGPTACCHLLLKSSSSVGISFTPGKCSHIQRQLISSHTHTYIHTQMLTQEL